jgi:hypothetical protein
MSFLGVGREPTDRANTSARVHKASRTRMALAAALGSVCVLAVAGVADSATVCHTSKSVANGPRVAGITTSATRIIGVMASERSLFQEILAALTPTHIRISSCFASCARRPEAPSARGRAATTWELLVVGVVFFDRSADEHLPRVLEVDASQVGWPTIDNISPPRPPRATRHAGERHRYATDDAPARARLWRRGRGDHRLGTRRLAVLMRLRVSDAAKFLEHQLTTFGARRRRPRVPLRRALHRG